VTPTDEPDRIPLNLDRIANLSNFIRTAEKLADDYTQGDPTWSGLPGSKATAEAGDPTAWPALLHELNGAYAFAQVRLLAVLEYAESISILCSGTGGPSGSLAIDVLTRSAVETASRARWVLEDGLTTEQRTSRYLAIEVHSAHHLDRVAQAMKLVPRDPSTAPTQMTAVKARCSNAGLRVTMENSERPRVGAERLSTATDLVLALVEDTPFAHEGKSVYGLGSGVAHGASFALLGTAEGSVSTRLVRV